jgi:single-strand DNA-binding protein
MLNQISANGNAVTKFSVATDDGYGEKRETTWHNVVTFQKTAEACAQYLDKGSLVAVVGRQTHRRYEGKDGTRYFAEIVADRVQFLDSKSDRNQAGEYAADVAADNLPF